MVAAMTNNEKSADVTIYGMNCLFCEMDFDFIQHLVMHMVNDHDEMWIQEKNYVSLKDIKIDSNLLEETKRILIEEGDCLECDQCGTYFDLLDQLLGHLITRHERIFRGNKFLLTSEFLFKNGFVDDEEEYYDSLENLENNEEQLTEEFETNANIRKHWELIDSDDEFDYFDDAVYKRNEEKSEAIDMCDVKSNQIDEKNETIDDEIEAAGERKDDTETTDVKSNQIIKESVSIDDEIDAAGEKENANETGNKSRKPSLRQKREINYKDTSDSDDENSEDEVENLREELDVNEDVNISVHSIKDGNNYLDRDSRVVNEDHVRGEDAMEEIDTDVEDFVFGEGNYDLLRIECDECDFVVISANGKDKEVPYHVHIFCDDAQEMEQDVKAQEMEQDVKAQEMEQDVKAQEMEQVLKTHKMAQDVKAQEMEQVVEAHKMEQDAKAQEMGQNAEKIGCDLSDNVAEKDFSKVDVLKSRYISDWFLKTCGRIDKVKVKISKEIETKMRGFRLRIPHFLQLNDPDDLCGEGTESNGENRERNDSEECFYYRKVQELSDRYINLCAVVDDKAVKEKTIDASENVFEGDAKEVDEKVCSSENCEEANVRNSFPSPEPSVQEDETNTECEEETVQKVSVISVLNYRKAYKEKDDKGTLNEDGKVVVTEDEMLTYLHVDEPKPFEVDSVDDIQDTDQIRIHEEARMVGTGKFDSQDDDDVVKEQTEQKRIYRNPKKFPAFSEEGLLRLINLDLGLFVGHAPYEEFSSEMERSEINIKMEEPFEPPSKKVLNKIVSCDEQVPKMLNHSVGTDSVVEETEEDHSEEIDKGGLGNPEKSPAKSDEVMMNNYLKNSVPEKGEEEDNEEGITSLKRKCKEDNNKSIDKQKSGWGMEMFLLKEKLTILKEKLKKRTVKVTQNNDLGSEIEKTGDSIENSEETEERKFKEEVEKGEEEKTQPRNEKTLVLLVARNMRSISEKLQSLLREVGTGLNDDDAHGKLRDGIDNIKDVESRSSKQERKESIINVWIRMFILSNPLFI